MKALHGWLAGVLLMIAGGCQAEPTVAITTAGGKAVTFYVEVADTPQKRELGLMYRKEMAADRGMIFIFPQESPQSFWMKNTPLPLDMIFINAEKKIVGIVEQAVPFSLDPRGVSTPSQFVLEINGGLAKQHGIRVGDSARFEGIDVAAVKQ